MRDFLLGAIGSPEDVERMEGALAEKTDGHVHRAVEGDVTLLSSQDVYEGERFQVAVNGYFLGEEYDSAATFAADRYREDGRGFVETLRGSFRIAAYDSEDEVLSLLTDQIGSKQFYYAEVDDGIAFSSYLTPLLAHSQVDNLLDRYALNQFMKSFPLFYGGGRTLIEGIRMSHPSHLLTWDGTGRNEKRYGELYPREKISMSDEKAVKRLDDLLDSGARELLEKVKGRPNILMSGGLDSSFLVSFLQERSDQTFNTYTFGWVEEHLAQGEKRAEELGTSHTGVILPADLPDVEDLWVFEEAFFPYLFIPSHHFIREHGFRNIFTGLSAVIPFPVGLEKLRTLERVRPLKPVFQFARYMGIDRALETVSGWRVGAGSDVLCSPYHSACMANARTIRRQDMDGVIADEADIPAANPERTVDERWELEDGSFEENFNYLQLRVREGPWSSTFWHQIPNHDLFAYTPLVAFAQRLPMEQRKNRRLLKRVAEGYVPGEVVGGGPSGETFVAQEDLRRRLNTDQDVYRREIERLMLRPFVDRKKAKRILQPSGFNGLSDQQIFYITTMYMLEKWIQTFIDRDEPWKRP